jgi:mannobiose 2-epimerase
MDETSLYNECEDGNVDTKKVWWVQAEAILGFLNGYQKDESRTDYLTSAGKIWDFTKTYMIDHRKGSEWFNELYKDGTPIKTKEIVGPWKCPYHNGRMCFEVINRNIAF